MKALDEVQAPTEIICQGRAPTRRGRAGHRRRTRSRPDQCLTLLLPCLLLVVVCPGRLATARLWSFVPRGVRSLEVPLKPKRNEVPKAKTKAKQNNPRNKENEQKGKAGIPKENGEPERGN